MVVGAVLPVVGLVEADGTSRGAAAVTARGADPGTGGLLLHLHTFLHGTDRLMVQALKTDRDLPVTTRRRQIPSRYVAVSGEFETFVLLTVLQDEKAVNELRERELKEKIKKMRSSKSGDDHIEANAA
jgi:hypothetical protein